MTSSDIERNKFPGNGTKKLVELKIPQVHDVAIASNR